MTLNRQIKTDFNTSGRKITLEAIKGITYEGKNIDAGQSIEVSKSEAKRLLISSKGIFKVKID